MKEASKFEEKYALYSNQNMPENYRDSLVNIEGSMDWAISILKQHFGEKFSSSDAVKVCEMIIAENARLIKREQAE